MNHHPSLRASRLPSLSRRQMLRLAAAGVAAASSSGWIEALAADASAHPARRRACILLWMYGGPSQIDTFDLKPGHENGGRVLQVSGLTYTWDAAVPEGGERVKEARDRTGAPLSRSRVYVVAANDYLVARGDAGSGCGRCGDDRGRRGLATPVSVPRAGRSAGGSPTGMGSDVNG